MAVTDTLNNIKSEAAGLEPEPAINPDPMEIDDSGAEPDPKPEDGVTISEHRRGHKRELEFAIKTMSTFANSPVSRTRSRNRPVYYGAEPDNNSETGSRAKKTKSGEYGVHDNQLNEEEVGTPLKTLSSNKTVTKGQLTKKDMGFHKLVFEPGVLAEGTKVTYYADGKDELVGEIRDGGIFCSHCLKVVTASQFETCAGQPQRKKAYNYIYLEDGVSLHELSVRLSKEKNLSNRKHDDLCTVCKKPGELLPCDLCPRAYHEDCEDLSIMPEGQWHCSKCRKMHEREKFVEYNVNALAAGRILGTDPVEQIIKRITRIMKAPETEAISCVLCRQHEFSTTEFGPNTVMICDQCNKEYHVGCLKAHDMDDLKELPKGDWFCCTECNEIYNCLRGLVFQEAEKVSDLDLNEIRRKLEKNGVANDANVELKWSLQNKVNNNADKRYFLARAVHVIRESFDPIVHSETGIDLIPPMVFGYKFSEEWDFTGMYCAVLTEGDSVISAAVLNVHGTDLAELPLVATRKESEGLGYFRTLFNCIEKLLKSLKVKRILLPAAHGAENIWTKKFGFSRITMSQFEDYTQGMAIKPIIFEGTTVLQKQLMEA